MAGKVSTGSTFSHWKVTKDDDRVELIRDRVYLSASHPVVEWVARKITAKCVSRDDMCEIKSIFNAVKYGPIPLPLENKKVMNAPGMRFVDDPLNIDTYHTAYKILEWMGQGVNGWDCDDHSIMVCSLGMSLGFQPGVVIVSKDGKNYIHIFPVLGTPKDYVKNWRPMDTTVKESHVDWMPSANYGIKAMKVYALLPKGEKMKGRRFF